MDEIMISLKGMRKSFGNVQAVSDVSMDIGRGEVRALIGENGSGKSTLAALITGAQKADGGTIEYQGHPFVSKGIVDAKKRGIAVLVQEKGTVNGLTVAENVFLGTAEDAQKDGAELIQPTIDKVTYSDGMTEEVYGFNVPVEKLDEEFDLAIIGKKGKWYDHKVSVTDVQEQTEEEKNAVEIGEEEKSEDADTTTDAAAEEENKD